MRCLLALFIGSFAAPVSAAEWVKVGTAASGTEVWFDSETLQRNGTQRAVWLKLVHTKPNDDVVESKERLRLNCASRQYTVVTYVDYSRSGDVIASKTFKYPEWVDAAPETMADAYFRLLCG